MGVVAAIPKSEAFASPDPITLTFVVPATDCNLNCPACYIKARREVVASENSLSIEDYRDFLRMTFASYPTTRVSVQGYEPLLPESWPYTKAILEEAKAAGAIRAVITNGTYLKDHLAELAELSLDSIAVSLDAHDASRHDLTRGKVGAFQETVSSIRAALSHEALRDKIVVASMLQPRKRNYLEGMAGWLAALGVQKWLVTPVMSPKIADTIDDHNTILGDLAYLSREAVLAGVEYWADDEFSLLKLEQAGKVTPLVPFRIRRLANLEKTVRMSPSGRVSVGMQILSEANDRLPRWNAANESPETFLQRVLP